MKNKQDRMLYIKLFILIVAVAALVSTTYKIFLLVKDRSFRFDTFNVMVMGEDVHVVGINTQKKQVGILEFNGARNSFSRKDILSASITVGVPLDGIIISIRPENLVDRNRDFPTFIQTLSFLLEDEKYVFHDINKFDLVKLYFISRLISWEEKNYEAAQDQLEIDSKIGEKFYDSIIFNEKTSIEVINSTDINGLGGRFGFILSNLGMNVISIRDGVDKKTQILANNLGVITLRRIEDLLKLKAKKEGDAGIADVTVNLGKDILEKVEE